MPPKPKNYWTKENCLRIAKKFKTRNDFKINAKGAYDAARKNKWIDEICVHMNSIIFQKYGVKQTNKNSSKFWTKERCREEANKYSERKEFMKFAPSAYAACLEMGWLCELADHQTLLKIKWTKSKCIEIAKNCKTLREFRKNNAAYLAARRNNWFAEIKTFLLIGVETRWSKKENIILEARKYKSKNEFRKSSKGAYEAAYRNGFLEEVCSHMKSPVFLKYNEIQENKSSIKYWTLERCNEEALKYNSRREFVNFSPSAYSVACKNGWLNLISKHQKVHNKSWTKEECHLLALNFNNKKDFISAHKGAYIFALRRGWKDDICSHMNINFIYWTKEMCETEALKYDTKKQFRKSSPKAYAFAQQNNIIEDICSHMTPLGNLFNRMIYCYEFFDKSVYIGITYNEEKRRNEHLNDKRGPVAEHIRNTGLKPEYKKLSGYINVAQAQIKEQEYINLYKQNGWNLLNSTKAGALGGNKRKWTKEEILRVSKFYNRKLDFQKSPEHYTAYNAARKMGILTEVCENMIGKKYWTKETVIKEAKKFSSMSAFMKGLSGAYNYASRNKFRNELIFNKNI